MLARAASSLRARTGRSVFDFDRDRGKMCAMACHVGFPYIDILRYGGTVPGNEPGTAKFCCPEVDTLNVWLAEIVDE